MAIERYCCPMMKETHKIVFLVVDGFQSLDLFGPLEAFAAANELAACGYDLSIAAFDKAPVESETGTKLIPDAKINELARADTLVLCGGRGPRTVVLGAMELADLKNLAANSGRVVSVCTGAFLMGQIGLADDRSIATHWKYADDLAEAYPAAKIDADALFRHDGKIWSSAGITAGIDLSLALIAKDFGRAVSVAVARHLVVHIQRTGDQAQYSEPLMAQSLDGGRLSLLLEWMTNNLTAPMDVETLADRVALGPRQFARIFREITGQTPARYVEHLRLDNARLILAEGMARIDQVSSAVGFKSADSFRRAFERRFSLSPSQYQARFAIAQEYPEQQEQ